MHAISHYGILVDGIAQLMTISKVSGSSHPFISILEMESGTWPYLLQQLSSLINCQASLKNLSSNCMDETRLLINYILFTGEQDMKISMWNLLYGKLNYLKNPELINIMLESFIWQQVKRFNFMLTNFKIITQNSIISELTVKTIQF